MCGSSNLVSFVLAALRYPESEARRATCQKHSCDFHLRLSNTTRRQLGSYTTPKRYVSTSFQLSFGLLRDLPVVVEIMISPNRRV